MSKHKHHIIPVYHCKELGIDPDFDENYVMVERLDHARIHWGYKCDDLEPLFEYITPAQWIIDLIPRGNNKDAGASGLIAKGELNGIDISGENHPMWKGGIASKKLIFDRVYKELSRFPYSSNCYACCPKKEDCSSDQWRTTGPIACTMPLWGDDYIRELDHENKIKETKRRISDGYEGRNRGEKLQAYCLGVPRKQYKSLDSMHRDSGSLSSLNEFKRILKRIVRITPPIHTHKYP